MSYSAARYDLAVLDHAGDDRGSPIVHDFVDDVVGEISVAQLGIQSVEIPEEILDVRWPHLAPIGPRTSHLAVFFVDHPLGDGTVVVVSSEHDATRLPAVVRLLPIGAGRKLDEERNREAD